MIMHIRPAPSPRGTNHTRTFIFSFGERRDMAFDATPQPQQTANGPHQLAQAHTSDTVKQLSDWIKANLSHSEQLALCEQINAEVDGTSANPAPPHLVASRQPMAQDTKRTPLQQTQRPSPTQDICDLASRVRIDNIGIQPKPLPPPSAAKAEGFFSRFPGARNVKLGA